MEKNFNNMAKHVEFQVNMFIKQTFMHTWLYAWKNYQKERRRKKGENESKIGRTCHRAIQTRVFKVKDLSNYICKMEYSVIESNRTQI